MAAIGLVVVAGCSDRQGSTAAFCEQVRKVPSLESVLSRFAETDLAVLEERIDKARDAYRALADAAPASLESDAHEVVGLVDDILAAVEAHPDDPAKAADRLRAAVAERPEVESARSAVAAFAADECDVVLDTPIVETTSTTGG